jgi:hypothetical protein
MFFVVEPEVQKNMRLVVGCYHQELGISAFADKETSHSPYPVNLKNNATHYFTVVNDIPIDTANVFRAYFPEFKKECQYCKFRTNPYHMEFTDV